MLREDIDDFIKTIPENVKIVAATKYVDANTMLELYNHNIKDYLTSDVGKALQCEISDKSKIEAFITRQISIIILQDKKREAKRILENISITAGISTPKFYILEDEKGLNAFATGTTEKNCAVILTRGLLETLDKSEIEAVIAHEIAHIIYQDTKLMMVITLLIGFL